MIILRPHSSHHTLALDGVISASSLAINTFPPPPSPPPRFFFLLLFLGHVVDAAPPWQGTWQGTLGVADCSAGRGPLRDFHPLLETRSNEGVNAERDIPLACAREEWAPQVQGQGKTTRLSEDGRDEATMHVSDSRSLSLSSTTPSSPEILRLAASHSARPTRKR